MARVKVPHNVGDWFAVPLPGGGYALGVVVSADGHGLAFGCFFGPRHAELPVPEDTCGLNAAQAVLTCRFSDLHFIEGQWPIICRSRTWNRSDWPELAFRGWAPDGTPLRVEYSEDRLFQQVRALTIAAEEAAGLRANEALGSLSLERKLDRLLTPVS